METLSTAPVGARALTLDGTDLYVRDWGAGPPVVFLASWSLPSDSWGYQMLALSTSGHRAIAYDRRGHGRSHDPGRGFDFDTLADDLAVVLQSRALEGAVLVGHSMATGEIVRYLSRHGSDRVAGIVLVGTITPGLVRSPGQPDGIAPEVFARFRTDELGHDLPAWVDANMAPFVASGTSQGMRRWVAGMALGASLKAIHDCNIAISEADFSGELAQLAVPTLVIHGDRDVTCPLAMTGLPTASGVRNARLEVYEGAPHGLFLTHMERFNHDLISFVNTCAG